ncbi:MAG: hypothetical protein ACREE5_13440 [Acetobacteraceae bacterium]
MPERRLKESEYSAGPDDSIADLATFPSIRNRDRPGIDRALYPSVRR